MSKPFSSSNIFQASYSQLRDSTEISKDDDDLEPALGGTPHQHLPYTSISPHRGATSTPTRRNSARPTSVQFLMNNNASSSPAAGSFQDDPESDSSDSEGISKVGGPTKRSSTIISASSSPFQHKRTASTSSRRQSRRMSSATVNSATASGISHQEMDASGLPMSIVSGAQPATLLAFDGSVTPPPKYTMEGMDYAEGGQSSDTGDEEQAGYRAGRPGSEIMDSENDGLLMQASTTLVFAVSGLICAGWLLDIVQHWVVFVDISELIILIPILLNLKGNLEMNLASRLSTAANMGLLDSAQSRSGFIKGNLALLQVQSLTVGSVAGLFAFGLGMMVHPTTNNISEVALMIASSMLCASISSLVLGGFMCALVLICRAYRINPDNIACPLASSLGDLVTLCVLAGTATVLNKSIDTPVSFILLMFQLCLIPLWLLYVRSNKYVSEVVKEGWGPVFAAMVIASTAGLTLERYINQYPGMALISPVLNGLTGNIGSIYASRISTALHANIKENYKATERILFMVHIPIQIVFLVFIGILALGHVIWSVGMVLAYTLVALSLIVITLYLAKWITLKFWQYGYDPDNYALPIITSLLDVIGTAFLVFGFWVIKYGDGYSIENAE